MPLTAPDWTRVDTILIALRLALAGVFLLAAVTKLLDLPGTRQAVADFRVPSRLVRPAALGLPIAELAGVFLLISGASARIGGGVVAVLLLLFIGGIVAALRRGEAPDCHCFGQIHSEPVGNETLARNVVLLVAAVVVLAAGPGPSPGPWLRGSSGTVVALALTSLAAAILAYACLTLWRQNRRLTGHDGRSTGPQPINAGAQVPRFQARDLGGRVMTGPEILADGGTSVLVFTSATCGPCVELLPELAQWQRMLAGRLNLRVIAAGDETTNRQMASEHGAAMLFDPEGAASHAFGVPGTPSAVEIGADGRVASPPAPGAAAIQGLIRAALNRPSVDAQANLQVRRVGAVNGPTSA